MITKKTTVSGKATARVESAIAAGREGNQTIVKETTKSATKGYERAIEMGKEQVEAAVKAGAEMFKNYGNYGDVVAYGKDNVEAFVKSSTILVKGVQDLNKAWLSLAQVSVEESVEATKKIFGAKNVNDAVSIQSDLARANYEKLVNETRKMSDMAVKLAEEVATPITNRVNATVEKLTKPLAA
ncbi:MAG: phasin family protein [Rhodospirillales bacterium]|nr:phasin family protein [Rhodospirillales bacterium]